MNSSVVDNYIDTLNSWKEEVVLMRSILLQCNLTEALKWGKPCYMYNNKNLIVIQPFKSYFAILFMKGHLLNDPAGILIKTGPNTKVGRQIRFKNVAEIKKMKHAIQDFAKQAIALEMK